MMATDADVIETYPCACCGTYATDCVSDPTVGAVVSRACIDDAGRALARVFPRARRLLVDLNAGTVRAARRGERAFTIEEAARIRVAAIVARRRKPR